MAQWFFCISLCNSMFLVWIARLWSWSSEDSSHVLSTNEPQVLCSLSIYTAFNLYMISEQWILSNPPPPPPTHRSQMQKLIWSSWTKGPLSAAHGLSMMKHHPVPSVSKPCAPLCSILNCLSCHFHIFNTKTHLRKYFVNKPNKHWHQDPLERGHKSLQGAEPSGKGARRRKSTHSTIPTS